MKTTLDDLMARLEVATEGERELDAEIASVVLPGTVEWKQARFTGEMFPVRRFPALSGFASEPVERYTTSLDATLTLVPEGEDWSLVRRPHLFRGMFKYEAVLWSARLTAFGHTAPLAFCGVCLMHRAACRR